MKDCLILENEEIKYKYYYCNVTVISNSFFILQWNITMVIIIIIVYNNNYYYIDIISKKCRPNCAALQKS